MKLVLKVHMFYRIKIRKLMRYCSRLDPQKTAFAIAASICIGTIPLIGLTFLIAVGFGFVFRINQFIMLSVHVLVTPLQFLLFYPFVRIGQFIFKINNNLTIGIEELPDYLIDHTSGFLNHYLNLVLGATGIWMLTILPVGYIIYLLVLRYLDKFKNSRNKETKTVEKLQISI